MIKRNGNVIVRLDTSIVCISFIAPALNWLILLESILKPQDDLLSPLLNATSVPRIRYFFRLARNFFQSV